VPCRLRCCVRKGRRSSYFFRNGTLVYAARETFRTSLARVDREVIQGWARELERQVPVD
jgi:hypothetical protein